jgi:benzoyl-CoA reductase/2-hydroxyglutaryl-CoA dehydratase subunit BcrC/BadD/HgdB
VAAVLPVHYPRALLRAFDFLPVEVWGPPQIDSSLGAAHLQPYVCSVVRNALAFLHTDLAGVVDLIVVPHTCDSLQGLGSLLLDFARPRQPVIPMYLPRGRRESDVRFLADEFGALYRRLKEITGLSPSQGELKDNIRREEAADGLLTELHQYRRTLPLTQIGFYRLVRAREYLPAEVFSDLARATLAQTAESPQTNGAPVLLSGIVPEPMTLFEAMARMGGVVVADDLACCGRRLYPPGESEDPFTRMAESLVAAPPDSTRGDSIQDRLAHLVRLVQTCGARGVVFYDVKFCEPELFYLPALRKGLQQAGIPSIPVEVDLNDPLSQQVLTRLEAFLEMIG